MFLPKWFSQILASNNSSPRFSSPVATYPAPRSGSWRSWIWGWRKREEAEPPPPTAGGMGDMAGSTMICRPIYTKIYIYIFFIMYLSYIQFRFQYIHTSDVCLMETHGIFLHGFMEIIATCLVSFMICSKTRLIALSQKAAAESIKIKHVKSPPLGIFCRKQMTIPQECPNTVYSQTRLSNLSSVLETAAHPCCIRCQTISPERIWARKGPREALVRNLKWSKAHKSDPKNFPHDAMDETTPSNHWVSEPEILPGIVGTLVCSSNYPFSQNHGVENWPKLKKTNLRGSHFNPFGTSMIVEDVQQVANRIQQCFRSRCHCIFPHGLNDGNA